jgi:lipopolysaccharide export LptBFGC system permease protein LptF
MRPLLAHDVFPAAWPGLTLALVVLAAALAPRLGRPGGALLAAVSVLWLLVNGRMEGGVLLVLVKGHGLTAADLAGLTGLAVAAWVLVRGRV